MNQRSLHFGILITVLWLLLIVVFAIFGDLTFPQSLNELGDFLAGIFAPIAFFWLVLGYMQQAKQLEQNTQALKQQEQALQLQIEEMRESVRQQKELVIVQNNQFESQLKMVEPIFLISDYDFDLFGSEIRQDNLYTLKFKISNVKGEVYNFRILSKHQESLFHTTIISTDPYPVTIKFENADIDYSEHNYILTDLYFEFTDTYSSHYRWKYKLYIGMNFDEFESHYRVELYKDKSVDLIDEKKYKNE